jgi:hypothetical protein
MGGRGGFSHGYHVYIPRSPLSLSQKQKGFHAHHPKTNKKTKRDSSKAGDDKSDGQFDKGIKTNAGGKDENEAKKEKR